MRNFIEWLFNFFRPLQKKIVEPEKLVPPTPQYDCHIYVYDEPKIEPSVEPIKPKKLVAGVYVTDEKWCGGGMEIRQKMFELAKRVCIEEGLFPSMTKDLLATVYGESGFNPECVNPQSLDYGVAQFSARYYLKEYKMSPQEAIDNPEKCLRIMARNFRGGRQSNWVAYKGRAKFFPKVSGDKLL